MCKLCSCGSGPLMVFLMGILVIVGVYFIVEYACCWSVIGIAGFNPATLQLFALTRVPGGFNMASSSRFCWSDPWIGLDKYIALLVAEVHSASLARPSIGQSLAAALQHTIGPLLVWFLLTTPTSIGPTLLTNSTSIGPILLTIPTSIGPTFASGLGRFALRTLVLSEF